LCLGLAIRKKDKKGKETKAMLFYVKGGPKDKEGPLPLPRDKFLEHVGKEWETVINFRQKGKIVEAYGYLDRPGGFIIYDVSSREELDKLLSKLPMHPFTEFEIVPLITAEQALELVKQGKISGLKPKE
jgi:muconolactone delta-isomerase